MVKKITIFCARWEKIINLGIKVPENSGLWYCVKAVFSDGEERINRHPSKTFQDALSVAKSFIKHLAKKKICSADAVNNTLAEIENISKEFKDEKPDQDQNNLSDPNKILIKATIIIAASAAVSAITSVYSALQKKSNYDLKNLASTYQIKSYKITEPNNGCHWDILIKFKEEGTSEIFFNKWQYKLYSSRNFVDPIRKKEGECNIVIPKGGKATYKFWFELWGNQFFSRNGYAKVVFWGHDANKNSLEFKIPTIVLLPPLLTIT